MGTGVSKELEYLVTTVRQDKGAQRITALKKLWDYSEKNENKRLLAAHQLGLLKELAIVINEDTGQARLNACGCVWFLSRDDKISYTLADPSLKMLLSLMKTVKEPNNADNLNAKIAALSALGNIALLTETHPSLLAPDIDLFRVMIRISREHELQTRQMSIKFLASMAKMATNETINVMISAGVLTLLAHLLKEIGSDESRWVDKSDGNCCGRWCIMLVMYVCRYRDAARSMKTSGGGKIIEAFLTTSSQTLRIYTIIGMGFVFGYGRSNRSLLMERKGAIDELVTVFKTTLESKSQIFTCCLLASCTLSLSLVPGNREIMVKSTILELLLAILRRYQVLDKPVTGPKAANAKFPWEAAYNPNAATPEDVETVEYCIDAMVQLSQFFKNDMDLRVKYMSPELGISELLTVLIDRSPVDLGSSYKKKMKELRTRLAPEAEDSVYADQLAAETVEHENHIDSSNNAEKASAQHLMISYSKEYKKELIIDLELSLRDLGYEVYRNEVGSALVGPINSSNITERMPEAVDASHTIIVCVSPAYKEDVNCLAEAKYIMQRLHQCDLKVIFLMLDPKFTTTSKRKIDGWLSFFVGAEIGYPLWDRLMVTTTTREIAKHIGDKCRSQQAKTMTKVMSIEIEEGGTGTVDYAAAWAILTNAIKARYHKALVGIMQDMGVMQQSDLALCDEEQLLLLGLLLRQLHQKAYLRAIGKA